nr:SWIM zinc finger family protein [bacterium]
IIHTATTLGLPTKGFVQRQGRVAHAYDSTLSNQVIEIDDGIFRVRSQSEPHKSYLVNINRGHPSCDCPDGQRTLNCKHRIASLLYLRREIDALTITALEPWPRAKRRRSEGPALERSEVTDETHKSCNQRGRWIVTDDQNKVVYHIYRDINGNLICPCGRKSDCKHRKAIKEYISKNKIKNECSTGFALEIQAKLNRHLNRLKNSTKESKDPSQIALRLDNPFEEADSYDIDQIESRRNGDLAWNLSNGQYIISYQGVMALAERHGIQFSVSIHDDANLVIATAMNGSQRASGKEVRFYGFDTPSLISIRRFAPTQSKPQPKGITLRRSSVLIVSRLPEVIQLNYLKRECDWEK